MQVKKDVAFTALIERMVVGAINVNAILVSGIKL